MGDIPRPSSHPAHPAFHIPLVNLTIPSNASASVIATQNLSTQTSCALQNSPCENASIVVQDTDILLEQPEKQDTEGTLEKSPCKSEKVEEPR